jgi:glutamyl-tRNA reductase
MDDPKEALKKKIVDLKAQLAGQKTAGKDLRKDLDIRRIRKALKRAQRRLALLSPLTFDQKVVRVAKMSDLIAKSLSELTQGAKKVQANPYVRSLRKKTKSLNKAKKKLDRIAKKLAARAKPAPVTPAASQLPASEGEKT